MMEEANWLQNMEGDLDSAHLDWVHRRLHEDSPKPEKGIRGFWNPEGRARRCSMWCPRTTAPIIPPSAG